MYSDNAKTLKAGAKGLSMIKKYEKFRSFLCNKKIA